MTAVAVSNASTPAPRRMSWHCFHCGANFSTTTRRALKVTCPKCHTSQDGPERIKQKLAELEELRKAGRAKHTPKAEPTPATPVAERPRARIVTKSPSPPASAPQPAPAAAEPPAPEPPAPPTPTPETKRRNLFDRVMGYER